MGDATSNHRILAATDVTKHFGGLRALEAVNLQVKQGEILGLIGPNGSGKTTFINVITGQLPITRGQVKADGVDITGLPPHQIARVGVIRTFQIVRLFKELTVIENVEVAAVSLLRLKRRDARKLAWEALERTGLVQEADMYAGTLPTGRERYLEIARAIVAKPAFLLLDEPGAGLNDSEVETLLEKLKLLPHALGCGLLVVDHDMRLIMQLCDRIHVLNQGRTIAEGSPDQVRAQPEVIEAYLGSTETETVHAAS